MDSAVPKIDSQDSLGANAPSTQQISSHSRSGLRLSKHYRDRALTNENSKSPLKVPPDLPPILAMAISRRAIVRYELTILLDTTLPLVERTNALDIQTFISRYIDSSRLDVDCPLPAYQVQAPSTQKEQIQIYSASTIPSLDFEGCFSLIEETSSEDYKASSIGWSPTKKRKEMRLPDMRYMVLRGPARSPPITQRKGSFKKKKKTVANSPPFIRSGIGGGSDGDRDGENNSSSHGSREGSESADSPVTVVATAKSSSPHTEVLAFLSFMTTYEDGKEVLYCYEIHIHPSLQGLGIGRHLMSLFEETGRRIGLEKAMLTVFTANSAAIAFYERLGYGVDEFSPVPRQLRNGTVIEPDYKILSKKF